MAANARRSTHAAPGAVRAGYASAVPYEPNKKVRRRQKRLRQAYVKRAAYSGKARYGGSARGTRRVKVAGAGV